MKINMDDEYALCPHCEEEAISIDVFLQLEKEGNLKRSFKFSCPICECKLVCAGTLCMSWDLSIEE